MHLALLAAAFATPPPAVGDAWFGDWTVSAVEAHDEFLRITATGPAGRARIEIVAGRPDDTWSSACCRVQPLPDEEADIPFFKGTLAMLEAREASGETIDWFIGAPGDGVAPAVDASAAPKGAPSEGSPAADAPIASAAPFRGFPRWIVGVFFLVSAAVFAGGRRLLAKPADE